MIGLITKKSAYKTLIVFLLLILFFLFYNIYVISHAEENDIEFGVYDLTVSNNSSLGKVYYSDTGNIIIKFNTEGIVSFNSNDFNGTIECSGYDANDMIKDYSEADNILSFSFPRDSLSNMGDYSINIIGLVNSNFTFNLSKYSCPCSIECELEKIGAGISVNEIGTTSEQSFSLPSATITLTKDSELIGEVTDAASLLSYHFYPGSYNLTVDYPETDHYEAGYALENIEVPQFEVEISCKDTYCGETPSVSATYFDNVNQNPMNSDCYTLLYSNDNISYSEEIPTKPGKYYVSLNYKTDEYKSWYTPSVADFNVKQYNTSLELKDSAVGVLPDSKLEYYADDSANKLELDSSNYYLEYKLKGANDESYSDVLPSTAGTYTARVVYISDKAGYYKPASCDFNILSIKTSLTIPDIYYGESLNPSLTYKLADENITMSKSEYTLLYKKKTDPDSSFSSKIPTDAAEYTAKAVFTSSIYESCSCDFAIKKYPGEGKIEISDTDYNEEIKVKLISTKNGIKNVEVYYKKVGADDNSYTKDKPKLPGKYQALAVFKETEKYEKFEAKTEFSILKIKGECLINAKDIYLGEKLNITALSKTNSNENVVYEYKKANETEYSLNIPSEIGNYTVKAIFPETEIYYEIEATADFNISYMPAVGFSIKGTKGNNGFYTSDVTIIPEDGYLISTNFNADYVSALKFNQEPLSGYMYFKNAATGALSDKVKIPDFKIDNIYPYSEKLKKGDNCIFANQLTLTIYDENLSKVLLEGKELNIIKGKTEILLDSEYGQKEYEILAVDKAGNEIKYNISILAPWLEKGIIPANTKVRLSPSKAYKLDQGKWKIDGDNTVYAGENQIYVSDEKYMTFNNSK